MLGNAITISECGNDEIRDVQAVELGASGW